MSIFGTDVPMVKLGQRSTGTIFSTITFPRPDNRIHQYLEEHVTFNNYKKDPKYKQLRYRFYTKIRLSNLSNSDMQNLITIANWNEDIWFYPSSSATYYAELVEVDHFEPFYEEDNIYFDSAIISFKGVSTRSKIVTPDNLILAKGRTLVEPFT